MSSTDQIERVFRHRRAEQLEAVGKARTHAGGVEVSLHLAFGIDPAWAPLDSERANRSLGIAETQLLRRLNRRLELPMWRDATYDGLIRELLAQEVLVSRDSIPVRLPPDRFDFAEAQGEQWIDWIKRSGVDVVGDVEDLRPRRPAPDGVGDEASGLRQAGRRSNQSKAGVPRVAYMPTTRPVKPPATSVVR